MKNCLFPRISVGGKLISDLNLFYGIGNYALCLWTFFLREPTCAEIAWVDEGIVL